MFASLNCGHLCIFAIPGHDVSVYVYAAGAVTIIVSLGVCMCYRHRRRRRRRREAKTQALALTPEEPKAKDDTEFMSMAWSVAHEGVALVVDPT